MVQKQISRPWRDRVKIFLLCMILYNGDINWIGSPPHKNILVASPGDAAIALREQKNLEGMNDHWRGKLYEIEASSPIIKEIDIPSIEFK